VGSHKGKYKDTKHREATGAKKGPLVAALFCLAGLVRLQHVLVNQQLR
jgi:hypothetical protein